MTRINELTWKMGTNGLMLNSRYVALKRICSHIINVFIRLSQ
jgi:hypothetical protein